MEKQQAGEGEKKHPAVQVLIPCTMVPVHPGATTTQSNKKKEKISLFFFFLSLFACLFEKSRSLFEKEKCVRHKHKNQDEMCPSVTQVNDTVQCFGWSEPTLGCCCCCCCRRKKERQKAFARKKNNFVLLLLSKMFFFSFLFIKYLYKNFSTPPVPLALAALPDRS